MSLIDTLTSTVTTVFSALTGRYIGKRANQRDLELMIRIIKKDKEALAELYSRYSKRILVTVLPIVRNKTDAKEILHETFICVWQKAHQFDEEKIQNGNVYAWLVVIARNRAKNLCRKNGNFNKNIAKLKDEISIDPGPQVERPDEEQIKNERNQIVRESLEDIPTKQRQVVDLYYFSEASQKEVAEILKIPEGTVKTRLRLGLEKLGDILKLKLGITKLP